MSRYPELGEEKPHITFHAGMWDADYREFYLRQPTLAALVDVWDKLYTPNHDAPIVHVPSLNCWLYDLSNSGE